MAVFVPVTAYVAISLTWNLLAVIPMKPFAATAEDALNDCAAGAATVNVGAVS